MSYKIFPYIALIIVTIFFKEDFMENFLKMNYVKPEVVDFKWIGSLGSCASNGTGDNSRCSYGISAQGGANVCDNGGSAVGTSKVCNYYGNNPVTNP